MNVSNSATVLFSRLARATHGAGERGIDTLLITPGASLSYLTGYHALPLERLTCLLASADGRLTFVVPFLELTAVQASPIADLDVDIRGWRETDDPYELVRSLIASSSHVAVDDAMPAAKVLALQSAMPGSRLSLASSVISELRMRKDAAEIEALRVAGAAIDRVHAQVPNWLRAGRTEHEIGQDIATAIIDEGHDRVDFVIVGSGPNSASPHHELSDRVVEVGDPVVVDIGGTMPSGYCSDCTRTYSVGQPPSAFVDYYTVLQQAQEAARAHARPGVTAESIDDRARELITAAGYGDRFIHRTGHGIGLETHEEPYIVSGNHQVIEPGMAFSIEPGIYLDGQHGARIEDIVIVTTDGVESVNHRSRDLVIVE